MKKQPLLLWAWCLVLALTLSACGGTPSSSAEGKGHVSVASRLEKSSVTEEEQAPNNTGFSAKDAIKIEELDWSIAESVLDGERFISFNYTNNSKYTVLDMEIRFKLKEGLTPEDMTPFAELKADREWTDEELMEVYIEGVNQKCAAPGETVADSPCYINGTGTQVETMAQVDLMEPEMASIAIIGDDGLGYAVFYDFMTKAYGESSSGGHDLHEWSDSELSSLIPKAEFTAVSVTTDEEDRFYFRAYDASREAYKSYVEAVKEKGFTQIEFEGDGAYPSYRARNGDGIEVDISYNPMREEMGGSLEKLEDTGE